MKRKVNIYQEGGGPWQFFPRNYYNNLLEIDVKRHEDHVWLALDHEHIYEKFGFGLTTQT